MLGEIPTLDNLAGAEPTQQDELIPIGEAKEIELPVLTDVVDTSEHAANFADSYLPEGVADLTGHGFAEAPPKDDEAIPGLEVAELFDTSAYDKAMQDTATKTFDPDALTLVPKEGEVVVASPAENLSAYDKAMQETVTRVDDLSGLSLAPKEVKPAAQELDAQGDAMMALIENTPVSPGLGNELNPVEQPSTSVKVSAPGGNANAAPAAAAEQAPDKKEIDKDILGSYQERFGINPEELKSIEGFETLSRGQQRQVLENLAQLTIGRIREDAVEGHDKDLALEKAAASKFGSKFLGKVWVGMKDSFTKKFDIVNREKKLASEIEKGGMKEHEVVLKQMVEGMKTFGPAIKENAETGGLEIQFIETEGMSPGVAKVAEVYNEKGTAFSKIPYEWSLDTATKEQQESFVAAKEAYEVERGELLMHMKKAGGKDGDVKAIAAMAQTESVIEMQRFMQTAPDAAEELTKIENQNAWTQALGSVGTERGLYMAGGALARTAIGAMAGLVAAPAVAFASGAIRGWRRTGDELNKQDVEQRKGVLPAETAKTAETRALIAKINESITTTTDEHTKDQLKMDLYELNKSLRGTTKNMIESANKDDIAGDKEAESGDRRRGATAKIGYLKAKIASLDEKLSDAATDEERNELSEKKSQLMAQLSRRMNYTKQKISEGRVVFGVEAERIGNQYALTRSMAEAEVMLATEVAVDGNGDKAAERLARLLNSTDDQIKKARFNKKFIQAAKAGAIGGVFAELGAGAADMFKWVNGGDSALRGLIMGQETAGGALPEIVAAAAVGGSVLEGGDAGQSFMEQAELSPAETLIPLPTDFPPMPSMDINEGVAGMVNGHDLPPDYVFPVQGDGINGLDLPPDYVFPGESLGLQEVHPGDTMTSILRGKFPGITDTQIENLRSQDLTKFGISSGNLDRIGLDDKLDMDKFAAAIKAGRGAGGAVHAAMTGGAAVAGVGGGITETVEVFPNTALVLH